MDLSVVIVNYGTFELTKNTVNSILDYSYPFDVEIIIVDNASKDDSLSKLRKYFDGRVKFIASEHNNGFAAGNNQALRIVDSKYVLLLNSDTIVWKNTLENIYHYMENNSDVGACGCQVLLEDNTLDKACKRSFPNVKNSFFRLFHIPTNSVADDYNLDDLDDDGVYEIDCLTGAFIFTRKKVLDDIGLLDETFFMYGEDIDTMSLGNRMILLDISHNVRPRGKKRANMPKAWPSLVNGMATGDKKKIEKNTYSGSTRRQSMRNDLIFKNLITPTTVINK